LRDVARAAEDLGGGGVVDADGVILVAADLEQGEGAAADVVAGGLGDFEAQADVALAARW
jgi:hypothetical protein